MITSIELKLAASYNNVGTIIDSLKKVNFFFGNNGTGKSTLSKFLFNLSLDDFEKSSNFSHCSHNGFNDSNHQILVFNEEFMERNFISRTTQVGIFSLNEANELIDNKIKDEQISLKKYDSYLNILKNRNVNIEKNKNIKFDELKDQCFDIRKNTIQSLIKIKDNFPNKQKQNNYDEVLKIIRGNETLPNISFESLLGEYQKYYNSNLVKVENTINMGSFQNIIEIENQLSLLLQKIIIGNNDVDIASLINKLEIKKWVEDGLLYLDKEQNSQICPFCQKETIDRELIEKFESFFDEAYKKDIESIQRLKTEYNKIFNSFISRIETLSKEFNIDNKMSNLQIQLKEQLNKNIEIIESKVAHSNEKKEIYYIAFYKHDIVELNISIQTNNEICNNLNKNKKDFERKVWIYIAQECKPYVDKFNIKEQKYSNLFEFISKRKRLFYIKSNSAKETIEKLRKNTISTDEAVEKINIILKNSGFNGFEIKEKSKTENNISEYCLKRHSGEDENIFKSLSEGEKNFIAFLYFYQLCLGTDSIDKSEKKKIIVIDDPVSSLDSQVLFIVNSLIQHLTARKGKSKPDKKLFKNIYLEQIFILTHNIYFFKEVSFDNQKTCIDRQFYTIKKVNNISTIEITTKPILNDYSLLWDSLHKIKETLVTNTHDKTHNISIANLMRRILESYVNFTGLGASVWNSIKEFDPADPINIICSSLISELQDGSHKASPLDDLYFTRIMNEEPKKLFDVFEIIFNGIGKEHYSIMMGLETEEDNDE